MIEHYRRRGRLVVLIGCLAFAVVLSALAIRQAAGDQRAICQAVNRFDGVVAETLRRSKKNLPRLTYFKAHPAELAAQLAEIDRQLALFQPQSC